MYIGLSRLVVEIQSVCRLCVDSTVAYADQSMCRRSPAVELRQSRGFLSNLVADETGCGSFDSAWWLAADPGQRLRLTLYDFAAGVDTSSSNTRGSPASTGRHGHGGRSGGRMVVCRYYCILLLLVLYLSLFLCFSVSLFFSLFLSPPHPPLSHPPSSYSTFPPKFALAAAP